MEVSGALTKAGGGFKIDHPLDPANKYLHHSFVESPERKNIYDGIAVCNSNGDVTVELPDWFAPLNSDFRYQLTPIGAPAANLYIAKEVHNNRFVIAGGTPGLKVSWQLTGVRRDAWAKANTFRTEEEKTGEMRGRYLHPEEHGVAKERGISHSHHAKAHDYLKGR